MRRFLGSVCLLVVTLGTALVGAPPEARAEPAAALSQDERVALALLGQMGAKTSTAARKARAARLFARLPDAVTRRALETALAVEPASLRMFAARALARRGDPSAAAPLLERVLRESQPAVRRVLAEEAGRLRASRSVAVLASALYVRDEVVRRRAAEALGFLGDVSAAPYLITKWEARSGTFPRSYFAQTRQVSYIQDFDVEVA